MITVTFDRGTAQFVLDCIEIATCSNCAVPLNADNVAGAVAKQAFCKDVRCQFKLSDAVKEAETNAS